MVDYHQMMPLTQFDEFPDMRLENPPPGLRAEQHAVAIGHSAPDVHAARPAPPGHDLGLGLTPQKPPEALDECLKELRFRRHPQQRIFTANAAPHIFVALADPPKDCEIV